MSEFRGLTQEIFAAYSSEKWSSNVYNLARMRAKDAALALCTAAQQDLHDELAGLDRAASDEVPNIVNHKKVDAQWIYWFRNAKERQDLASFLEKTPLDREALFNIAPQDKHVILAVVLRESELWVGLWLAPGAVVDRKNLAARLGKAWERDQLIELLKELPDGARLGTAASAAPTGEITASALAELALALGPDKPGWQLGHCIEREEAIALGSELADHVERWLGALLPIYRFIVWSANNDHIQASKQLHEEKQQKRRQAVGFSPGDKVRVISGLFSGKTGVVQEIDAKAQVRLRIGTLSVVVSGHDLTPAA